MSEEDELICSFMHWGFRMPYMIKQHIYETCQKERSVGVLRFGTIFWNFGAGLTIPEMIQVLENSINNMFGYAYSLLKTQSDKNKFNLFAINIFRNFYNVGLEKIERVLFKDE